MVIAEVLGVKGQKLRGTFSRQFGVHYGDWMYMFAKALTWIENGHPVPPGISRLLEAGADLKELQRLETLFIPRRDGTLHSRVPPSDLVEHM